ncbi:hypothetical protein LTR36_005646 [Oleoguttula mirabilis]|uniref:Uncharacterized protein n=1 Tax=Oleoguttula mirabilis TaxID=1507867 RepID=A0AAV9JET7_9PEZI|nr:hypothetical protein LTR36_005646 [Oleoguttula mirabilis]
MPMRRHSHSITTACEHYTSDQNNSSQLLREYDYETENYKASGGLTAMELLSLISPVEGTQSATRGLQGQSSTIAVGRTLASYHNSVNSPLLKLPAELRTQIYELLFPDEIMCYGPKQEGGMCMRWTPMDTPAIMKVCHKLRNEIEPMLFGGDGKICCMHILRDYDSMEFDMADLQAATTEMEILTIGT